MVNLCQIPLKLAKPVLLVFFDITKAFETITNMFSIMKVQERLTREIAEAVWEAVSPAGVGVVVEACHMCMVSKSLR